MQKWLGIVVLGFALVLNAYGEEVESSMSYSNQKMRMGVLGGLNLATFRVADGMGQTYPQYDQFIDRKTGIVLGISGEVPLSDLFYFSPELFYVQKGMVYNLSAFTGFQNAFVISLDCLEFPMLIKLKAKADRVHFSFFTGPALAVAIHKQAHQSNQIYDLTSYQDIDFSIHAGVGAEIILTPTTSLLFNGRYVHGLINQLRNSPMQDYKNRSLMFLSGFAFGL